MVKFPDTLFGLAGQMCMTGLHYGFAIPIFRSIENENCYFVQNVLEDKIVSFESLFEAAFEPIPESQLRARPGDAAITIFNTRTEGPIIGAMTAARAHLKHLIDQGKLYGEEKLEAARAIGDDKLIDELLEERYFQLSRHGKETSKFFLLNNFLRDRIVEKSSSTRLRSIMKDCIILRDASGVSVGFPARASDNERVLLLAAINERITSSKAFESGTAHALAEECIHPLEFERIEKMTSLDLGISKSALAQIRSRSIFFPVACAEIASNGGSAQTTIVETAIRILMGVGRDSAARQLSQAVGQKPIFSLDSARAIAAALYVAADKLGGRSAEGMLRIRICMFRIRELDRLRKKGWKPSHLHRKLFCIDAAARVFASERYNVGVTFADTLEVGYVEEIASENFAEDLGFGLGDEYLAHSVLSTHRLCCD